MICNLDIIVANKLGYSYLKDVYATQPFRIVPVGQNRDDKAAYLMIMSSSPGILSGDNHQIRIEVEANAMLQLKSQSYQRLFAMESESCASQSVCVKLAKNSDFSYVPHPIVPHQNSSFYSSNRIDLEDNCSFMLGEIITCGRKHSGESFQYSHFQNMIEVYHHDRLILKDNVLLQPSAIPLTSMGIVENYTHQATFVFMNTRGISSEELIKYFYEKLQGLTDVSAGISATQADGFVIRILGNGGEQLFDFLQQVQAYIWDNILLLNQIK